MCVCVTTEWSWKHGSSGCLHTLTSTTHVNTIKMDDFRLRILIYGLELLQLHHIAAAAAAAQKQQQHLIGTARTEIRFFSQSH